MVYRQCNKFSQSIDHSHCGIHLQCSWKILSKSIIFNVRIQKKPPCISISFWQTYCKRNGKQYILIETVIGTLETLLFSPQFIIVMFNHINHCRTNVQLLESQEYVKYWLSQAKCSPPIIFNLLFLTGTDTKIKKINRNKLVLSCAKLRLVSHAGLGSY